MNNPDKRMVLVEGLDLAGKSTLCQGLATRLRKSGLVVTIAKNNLLGQNAVGKLAKEYATTAHAAKLETGALFLASHLYDTTLFRGPIEGQVHIQDSSWLRTISYHTMQGTPIIPSLAEALFDAHPVFGAVIYLTASMEIRRARILARETACPGANTPGDFMSFTDPDFVARHDCKLMEITKRFYPWTEVVDTSSATPEDTIEEGWRVLRGVLN